MNNSPLLIRVGDDEQREWLVAETVSDHEARLIEIPTRHDWLSIFDVVVYDPATAESDAHGTSYAISSIRTHSGYRAFQAWAVIHRPQGYEAWLDEMEGAGIIVQEGELIQNRGVQILWMAMPAQVSALSALIRLNRGARTVEIITPVLAAVADDLDRAKSDLDRAVGWGASDADLTLALALVWERQERIDEAITFWERLSHIHPDDVSVREKLGSNYARLGVFPHAALEFDRAATLAEDLTIRLRLEQARDLMWQKSKV